MCEIFISEYYKIIKLIYLHSKNGISKITYIEMSDELNITRQTLKKYMDYLLEKEYVFYIGNGKYKLSEESIKIIKRFKI